jgi:hypothetical protein
MLTAKQEAFAQAIVSGLSQADAYRAAYNASAMKPATVQNKAHILMKNGEVRARVVALRAPVMDRIMTVHHLYRHSRHEPPHHQQGWPAVVPWQGHLPLQDIINVALALTNVSPADKVTFDVGLRGPPPWTVALPKPETFRGCPTVGRLI